MAKNRIDEYFEGARQTKQQPDRGEPPASYQGTWIPEYVMRLLWDHKLSRSEVMLLATINSLSAVGEGCYASNKYLAGILGFGNPFTVSKMIARLKSMKLVSQLKYDGRRRYLVTRWSDTRD